MTKTHGENSGERENEGSVPETEALPLDFVDFLCVLRGIERDTALALLSNYVLGFCPRPPDVNAEGASP